VVGLVRVLPILLCSLFAGVLADAVNRRSLLLVVNGAMLLASSALCLLSWLDLLSIGGLYAMAALVAGFSTFDNPARNSFFPMLVPRERLPDAIALNSVAFQFSAVSGPALGGLVIAAFGVPAVYALDALSFLAIFTLLLRMSPEAKRGTGAVRAALSLGSALEGLRFVFGHPLIRASMLLDFVATFFASAVTLLPVFAQDLLHVGARGYGLLASAMAVGSMLTSLRWVGAVHRIQRRGLWLLAAVAVYGLATAAFGAATSFALAWASLFVAGAADMVSTLLRQMIRQLETPDELRGRMASVNLVFFMGGPQLGELEAGAVAQAFGPRAAVISGGLLCAVSALWLGIKSPGLRGYRTSP
jgi:MFS family permease